VNTTTINGAGYAVVQAVTSTVNNPTAALAGAQQIVGSAASNVSGYSVNIFQDLFNVNCPQVNGTLSIASNSAFAALLNGVPVVSSTVPNQEQDIPISLSCGINNLTVVSVGQNLAPSAIFQVNQNQATCLQCPLQPLAIYNPTTCSCICPTVSACPMGQVFNGYPLCGCSCPVVQACPGALSYWNPLTCACSCPLNINCLQNYALNPATCTCQPLVCTTAVAAQIACPAGQVVNITTCACQCPLPAVSCATGLVTSSSGCTCTLPPVVGNLITNALSNSILNSALNASIANTVEPIIQQIIQNAGSGISVAAAQAIAQQITNQVESAA